MGWIDPGSISITIQGVDGSITFKLYDSTEASILRIESDGGDDEINQFLYDDILIFEPVDEPPVNSQEFSVSSDTNTINGVKIEDVDFKAIGEVKSITVVLEPMSGFGGLWMKNV